MFEHSAYLDAIKKIPHISPRVPMLPSPSAGLLDGDARAEMSYPGIRSARRAETLSRLAAVARELGEASAGLKRVRIVQAVRLRFITAGRLATAKGRVALSPMMRV
jgi:hypothetical protein